MKAKHWFFVVLVVVGGLFLFHNYTSHGGTAGVRQGLGFGGMSGGY